MLIRFSGSASKTWERVTSIFSDYLWKFVHRPAAIQVSELGGSIDFFEVFPRAEIETFAAAERRKRCFNMAPRHRQFVRGTPCFVVRALAVQNFANFPQWHSLGCEEVERAS